MILIAQCSGSTLITYGFENNKTVFKAAQNNVWIQLSEYETDPYFLQLSQMMKTDCL